MRHKIARIGSWFYAMVVFMFSVSTSVNAYSSNEPWSVLRVEDFLFTDVTLTQGDQKYVTLSSDTVGSDGSHDTYLNCTNVWTFSDPVYNWVVGSDWSVDVVIPKSDSQSNYENMAIYFFDKTKMPYYSKAESRWYNTTIDDMYPGATVADIDSYNTRLRELMSLESYGNSGIIIPSSYLIQYASYRPWELWSNSDYANKPYPNVMYPLNTSHQTNTIIEDVPVSNWFADTNINNLIAVIAPTPDHVDELATNNYSYSASVSIYLSFDKNNVGYQYSEGDFFPYVRPMDVSIVAPPVDATKQQELNDWVTNSGNMSQWDTDLGFELVPFVTSMLQPWMIKLMLVIFGFGVLMIFIRRSLHD